MKEKLFIVIYFLSLQSGLSIAQCPPKDSLKKEPIQQRLNAEGSDEKKLNVLLDYQKKILQCGLPGDTTYAWLLQQIAYKYGNHGKFSEAINYSLQALEINRAYPNDKAVAMVTITQYYWLSNWYDSLNNAAAKRKVIDSCIAVSTRINYLVNDAFISCVLDRTRYFYNIGEYKLCVNDAEICQKSAKEYMKVNTIPGYVYFAKIADGSSFHWQINALLQLKDFTTAKTLLAHKVEEYKKVNSKSFLAITYSQLAEVLIKENDYRQALANYLLAFKTYKETGEYFSCKQTLNNIGEKIYFNYFNDYDKAFLYFKNALGYKNNSSSFIREDSIESLNIYGRIANIYVEKKLFDSAFIYFQLAFNQMRKGATINQVIYSPPDEFIGYQKIDYLFNLLINYGDAYRKKYESKKNKADLAEAIHTYEKVDKFLARINISQFEQESRLLWRNDARLLYENAIGACLLANDAGKAFYFFERSRAALLNIQLTEQNWIAKTDILKQEELKRKIAVLTRVINNTTVTSNDITNLRDSLRAMNDELYSLQQLIKTHYPLYFQNMDTAVVTIEQVRNTLLKDRQGILEMFSGDHSVYSLLITAKSVAINKLDKADFEKTVNAYTTYLSNYSLQNKDFGGFRKTARHLYELIFQNNAAPPGRIIISPEGYYFPFESLIADNTSSSPGYFISDHPISYTYSVRYLFNNFGATTFTRAGNFLGVAPVVYSPGFHLSQLSGSDRSLHSIRSIFNSGNIIAYQAASRQNFLQQFKFYTINQLYTHSADSSERNEPVIYFNDSALYLSELIPEGKPVTELIVLSACETGNGKLYQGEGVFSFNRAFAAIGIPSSVSNLWSIDNKATYEITETFHKYLAKGLPPDIALQKAKLDYMNGDLSENRMPYYWAAAVLVGKSDRITLEKTIAWKYLVPGMGLFVILCFGVWKIIKKHKAAQASIPGIKEIAS